MQSTYPTHLFLFCQHFLVGIETLDRCFSHDTIEEIIQSLENAVAQKNDQWCGSTNKLKESSLLSMKVSLRSIREGRVQTLEQCLTREYSMSVQAISEKITNNFSEGIRAKLGEKDFEPKWDPPTLQHVSQDMVDQYFSELSPFEIELEAPTRII